MKTNKGKYDSNMCYISPHVLSIDIIILFSSVWLLKRTQLRNFKITVVTQMKIAISMKCETLQFVKCFQVNDFIQPSSQPGEVSMRLLPLISWAEENSLTQCHSEL